tara:strand:+ start:1239 stop:2126 length:888 start_codon:yes stop_codon:yes gene_type:complete
MSSREPEFGSSKLETFWYWITERHDIYIRRFGEQQPKPWTKDPILQQYKFTNAFRQLDRGTIALTDMISQFPAASEEMKLFNIWWYRLFNREEHSRKLGFITSLQPLVDYITDLYNTKQLIFTSAHMTASKAGEPKYLTYIRACEDAFKYKDSICRTWRATRSMEETYNKLLMCYLIGPFVGYEIVCDMRFLVKPKPEQINAWANVGPGSRRGLIRLGMLRPDEKRSKVQAVGNYAMIQLLHKAWKELPERIIMNGPSSFELREIEHSLCEFDKYERVRTGEGTPRSKFHGTLEV